MKPFSQLHPNQQVDYVRKTQELRRRNDEYDLANGIEPMGKLASQATKEERANYRNQLGDRFNKNPMKEKMRERNIRRTQEGPGTQAAQSLDGLEETG